MRLATLYTPGAYGTFISWCIFSFSTLNKKNLILPISAFGSGHLYRKHPGMLVVRPTHHILANYSNYVVLEYDRSRLINYLNNQFEKHTLGNLEKYLGPNFYENLEDRSVWAIRELLSISIKDMIEQGITQMDQIPDDSSLTCCYINPEDFLENPKDNLEQIYKVFGLEFNQYYDQISDCVSQYLAKQRNLTKHSQLNDFVTATVNNQEIILRETTILDEAYIQAKLSILGYSIRCYGLDDFPKSSTELHHLIDK